MNKSSIVVLIVIIVLVGWVMQSCAPVATSQETSQPTNTQGMPTLILESKAMYDRNDNFLGYRYFDADKGATCYLFEGHEPWCITK